MYPDSSKKNWYTIPYEINENPLWDKKKALRTSASWILNKESAVRLKKALRTSASWILNKEFPVS